jgi:hypothetical protein
MSLNNYLDKEVWYRILHRNMTNEGEKFDELKILSVYMITSSSRKKKVGTNKLELHINYMTEWSSGSYTSFGKIEVAAEDLPVLFREDKINQVIDI